MGAEAARHLASNRTVGLGHSSSASSCLSALASVAAQEVVLRASELYVMLCICVRVCVCARMLVRSLRPQLPRLHPTSRARFRIGQRAAGCMPIAMDLALAALDHLDGMGVSEAAAPLPPGATAAPVKPEPGAAADNGAARTGDGGEEADEADEDEEAADEGEEEEQAEPDPDVIADSELFNELFEEEDGDNGNDLDPARNGATDLANSADAIQDPEEHCIL